MPKPTKEEDDAVKAAIAATSPKKGVNEALRDIALILATEGGRASAAWLTLANAIGQTIGAEPIAPALPPELAPPLVALPSGNAALQGASTGVARRASGQTQLAAPHSSTGGRVVQTGGKAQTGALVVRTGTKTS